MKTTEKNLVLKMLEGPETGKLIPIEVEKCLLGVDPQCVVIRTPEGVQVQSSKGELLVNDVETKSQWLSQGDVVKLGSSVFEIKELGAAPTVEANNEDEAESEDDSTTDTSVTESNSEFKNDSEQENVVTTTPVQEADKERFINDGFGGHETESNDTADSQANELALNDRVVELESLLKQQNETMEERFQVVSNQLESLCDHLLEFEGRLDDQAETTENAPIDSAENNLSTGAVATGVLAAGAIAAHAVSDTTDAETVSNEELTREKSDTEFTPVEGVSTFSTEEQSNQEQPTEQERTEDQFAEAFNTETAVDETEEHFSNDTQPVTESEQVTEPGIDDVFAQEDSNEEVEADVFSAELETSPPESEAAITQEEPTFNNGAELDPTGETELEEDLGLSSLLESLQSEDAEAAETPDAEQALESLEERIVAAESSLDEPEAELESAFETLSGVASDETSASGFDADTNEFDATETSSAEFDTEEDVAAEPVAEATPSESVADVLARMGLQTEDQGEVTDETNAAATGLFENDQPAVAQNADTSLPQDGGFAADNPEGDGADVDDYMDALLTRLKGGPGEEATPTPTKKAVNSTSPKPSAPVVESTYQPPEPERVLKPEEFVPKSVAPDRSNAIRAMRELANQTVSTAVETSDVNRNREKNLLLQIGSVMGMLVGIILFYCSHRPFDMFFLIAAAATLAGFLCVYLLYFAKPAKPPINQVAQTPPAELPEQTD